MAVHSRMRILSAHCPSAENTARVLFQSQLGNNAGSQRLGDVCDDSPDHSEICSSTEPDQFSLSAWALGISLAFRGLTASNLRV